MFDKEENITEHFLNQSLTFLGRLLKQDIFDSNAERTAMSANVKQLLHKNPVEF